MTEGGNRLHAKALVALPMMSGNVGQRPARPIRNSLPNSYSQILIIAAWPILAAIVVARIPARPPATGSALFVTTSAIAFLAIVMLQPTIRSTSHADEGRGLPLLIAALSLIVAFLMISSRTDAISAAAGASTMIIAAAAVEEYVFRWVLPQRFLTSLASFNIGYRYRMIIGCVAAQVIFAACHFVGPSASFSWSYAARLFVGGLLYSNLVAKLGVFAAIAVHSAMNVGLGHSIAFWAGGVAFAALLVVAGGFAITGLWIQAGRIPCRSYSGAGPLSRLEDNV